MNPLQRGVPNGDGFSLLGLSTVQTPNDASFSMPLRAEPYELPGTSANSPPLSLLSLNAAANLKSRNSPNVGNTVAEFARLYRFRQHLTANFDLSDELLDHNISMLLQGATVAMQNRSGHRVSIRIDATLANDSYPFGLLSVVDADSVAVDRLTPETAADADATVELVRFAHLRQRTPSSPNLLNLSQPQCSDDTIVNEVVRLLSARYGNQPFYQQGREVESLFDACLLALRDGTQSCGLKVASCTNGPLVDVQIADVAIAAAAGGDENGAANEVLDGMGAAQPLRALHKATYDTLPLKRSGVSSNSLGDFAVGVYKSGYGHSPGGAGVYEMSGSTAPHPRNSRSAGKHRKSSSDGYGKAPGGAGSYADPALS